MPTTVISFRHAGISTLSWKADRNFTLYGLSSSVGNIVSFDPGALPAQFSGPGASDVIRELCFYQSASSINRPQSMTVPVLKGQTIYSSSTGAGTCQLFLT